MARNLTASMVAQVLASHAKPAVFVQINFADATLYLWSGLGTITWNGQNWTGLGQLGQISAIPETTDVAAQNITLALSGIPSSLVNEAINECRQNSFCYVWFGFLDASNNVISDPAQVFAGHLDVPTVTDGAETCTISITAENPLVDLGRAPNRRYTDCDQQQDFPGDLGFAMVGQLQNAVILWPNPLQ